MRSISTFQWAAKNNKKQQQQQEVKKHNPKQTRLFQIHMSGLKQSSCHAPEVSIN